MRNSTRDAAGAYLGGGFERVERSRCVHRMSRATTVINNPNRTMTKSPANSRPGSIPAPACNGSTRMMKIKRPPTTSRKGISSRRSKRCARYSARCARGLRSSQLRMDCPGSIRSPTWRHRIFLCQTRRRAWLMCPLLLPIQVPLGLAERFLRKHPLADRLSHRRGPCAAI